MAAPRKTKPDGAFVCIKRCRQRYAKSLSSAPNCGGKYGKSTSQEKVSEEHENLTTNAKHLRDLNSQLRKLLDPRNLKRDLTATEESVMTLCAECDSAADELVLALKELSIQDDAHVSGATLHKPQIG